MNIPQTSYTQYFASAILGMQAYASEMAAKISRIASGIIYYGRAVIQSRLDAAVCRMPRLNKIVITDDAGTFTAGSIVTTIVHGTIASGEVAGVSTSTVVTTAFATDKNTSLTNHAANIKAALADCFSCAYSSSGHTITYIGDAEDIISCSTSVTGITGTMTISSEAITSADVAADVIGFAYLTHDRQQQFSTGLTYYSDTEPVNIMRGGTIWVYGEEALTPADAVYVRMVTNSTKYAGYVGKSADSGKALVFAGAKFQKDITAAGLVPLTINLPQ